MLRGGRANPNDGRAQAPIRLALMKAQFYFRIPHFNMSSPMAGASKYPQHFQNMAAFCNGRYLGGAPKLNALV